MHVGLDIDEMQYYRDMIDSDTTRERWSDG